jgi:hypothetical protein
MGRRMTVGYMSKGYGKEVEETKGIKERKKEIIFPIIFDG